MIAVGRRVDDHTCCSTGSGTYWPCLRISTRRTPRASMLLRRRVEVGAELRERRHLAVLREVEAQRAGDLLHRLDLRRAADARHRDADVHGRADAGVEQVGLEEDLAVGDRDDVGRNVGRHVAGLRLDDRQRGQRAAALGRRSSWRRARAGASAGRRRRRDTLRGPADGAAAATAGGRRRPASRDRRR